MQMHKFLIQVNAVNKQHVDKVLESLSIEKLPYHVCYFDKDTDVFSIEDERGKEIDIGYLGYYIPYGSVKFIKIATDFSMRAAERWKFNHEYYVCGRTDMLNQECVFTKFKYIKFFDKDQIWFVKPLYENKKFTGYCKSGKWLTWAVANNPEIQELEVCVSPRKLITEEYRCFVVQGKIISTSYYKLFDTPFAKREEDEEKLKLFQQMADLWLPDENCTMDICKTESGEYKVVEFNRLNSSGFYDHDIKSVFSALYKYHEEIRIKEMEDFERRRLEMRDFANSLRK